MNKFLLLLFCLTVTAHAEPINIVMPVSPGGNIDVFARAFSNALTDNSIENIITYQAGGQGDIAYNTVMNKPDTSILVGALHTFVLSHVSQDRENIHSKNMKIFAPMVETPFTFLTTPNGFYSFKEMIEYAKNNILPCGVSNANSIELIRINKEYKTKFEPIPYKGTTQIKTDLLGNHIKCAYDGAGAYMKDNVKYLASNINFKDVTKISSVLTNYTFNVWFGIAIPNDSKLLKNEKLLTVIDSLIQNKEYTQKLNDHQLFINSYNKSNGMIDRITGQYRALQ